MQRTQIAFLLSLLLAVGTARAQTETKPVFGISFSGFVKTDLLYDARQTVSLREGHFMLYPKPVLADKDGCDVNAASSFHMLAVQTRLLGRITGPDAFGAKTSGLIEAEFFGMSDADINGFRLRHAYAKLNWPKTELLVGQFWHPLFITDSFPDVVSFNTGAPFLPFNRSPQIRLTTQFGAWSVGAAAVAQRDFTSNGPDGASTIYARNAALPEFNLKLQYLRKCASGCETIFGISADAATIRPRLATTAGYQTDETVSTLTGMAYWKLKTKSLTAKAEAIYGGNLHHLTMLGGYAVRHVIDATRAVVDYASLRTLSAWGELMSNGTKFQAGVFGGYAKNLGAGEDLAGPTYARGADIDRLARISPRVVFNSGKIRFAAECEWTGAWYGTPRIDGTVGGAKLVSNVRFLGAVYYFF